MFLYPHTITSLRHQWTHPAFGDVAPAVAKEVQESGSHAWLRAFAEECDLSYRQLMRAADDWLRTGEDTCLCFDIPDPLYTRIGEFWPHYEIATGTKVKDHTATFFTCAC